MRRLTWLLIALSVTPACGSESPRGYDSRAETVGIEGAWRLVELDYGRWGKGVRVKHVVTYRAGTYTVRSEDGETCFGAGIYRADPSRRPAQLDEVKVTERGRRDTVRSIYRVEGDRLTKTQDWKEGERPGSFEDTNIVTFTYRRVTP